MDYTFEYQKTSYNFYHNFKEDRYHIFENNKYIGWLEYEETSNVIRCLVCPGYDYDLFNNIEEEFYKLIN